MSDRGENGEKVKDLFPIRVKKAVEALLTNPAVTTPALRQAIEAHAARISGGVRQAAEIPTDLEAYINKVTRHAYKVTDQDVQQLKQAGYSEDAIFEITLCASVGAGLARFERGLHALKGDS